MSTRKRGRSPSGSESSATVEDKVITPSIDLVNAQALAALQASVAAQLAATSQLLQDKSILAPVSLQPAAKKAATHILRLDAQGNEIDEQGKIIAKVAKPVRNVSNNQRMNESAERKSEKKFNPYLAHLNKEAKANEDESVISVQDPRIHVSSREVHARKALQFVEAGSYIKAQEIEHNRAIEILQSEQPSGNHQQSTVDAKAADQALSQDTQSGISPASVSVPIDASAVPLLEWWDFDFLPKAHRDSLGIKKTSAGMVIPAQLPGLDTSLLDLQNCKTYKLLQHPPSTEPLKAAAPDVPLPLYLTERERKRIRKQRRMALEQEKRDKQMMGLIPAPEPKFKLSNFMRILGNQAIADPSKVEQKVIEQVRARELKHEMENLARKLTPAQRREKKVRKLQEAAEHARETHVAVFCISDLHSPKLRFKINKNAEQWLLSGAAVTCHQGPCNLVYIEGGPRAVRKFTHLMMSRIKWGTIPSPAEIEAIRRATGHADTGLDSANINFRADIPGEPASGDATLITMDIEDNEEEDDEEEEDEEVKEEGATPNICRLLWSGTQAKRTFIDFKFRDFRSEAGVRKMLEEKFLQSYWDMAVQQVVRL